MNIFDRINELALRRLAEWERDPGYKALQRFIEEEQRNPGLRIAREIAQRQIDEEQRNPALRILRDRLNQEQNNALLRIAQERVIDQQRLSIYDIPSRLLQQSGTYAIVDSLRDWEKRLPNWILGSTSHRATTFDSMMNHFAEAQRAAEYVVAQSHVEFDDLVRLQGHSLFANLNREFSAILESVPSSLNKTFLVSAAGRLGRIQQLSENHDETHLNREVDSFLDYILAWLKDVAPKHLTRDAALGIMVTVMVAALQQAHSYSWRLVDKDEEDRRSQEQNAKLDRILEAVHELQGKEAQPKLGKLYTIDRTTPSFARPGPRQHPIGYVYRHQSVLAITSTGRWILIEYTEPFNLEPRVGWIRKKYAKYRSGSLVQHLTQKKLRLVLAINSYKNGETSLGQAAELAGLTKKKFIDVLGHQHIPILNYSAEEKKRVAGLNRGTISASEDFDDPLPDEFWLGQE